MEYDTRPAGICPEPLCPPADAGPASPAAVVRPDLCLAPMRGVTDGLFRRVFHRHFQGLDRCMAPFVPLSPGRGVGRACRIETAAALAEPVPVIPQVLVNDPAALDALAEVLVGQGYERLNLNAGCPRPAIVRKRRGAGLLEAPDAVLGALLETGCARFPRGFSVKVRLGVAHAEPVRQRWRLLNEYPLAEVIVHARTAAQGYGGQPDLGAFAQCLAHAQPPLVYNGDIRSVADFRCLAGRFPLVTRWMLGRGLVGDPFLAESIRAGRDVFQSRRLHAFLLDFDEAAGAAGLAPAQALGRSKALWRELAAGFSGSDRVWREVRRVPDGTAYRRWMRDWFSAGPGRRPPVAGVWVHR